jgi:hypothetical protein
MRKRYRVVFLAAIVAAVVTPLGYALSVEPPPPAAMYARHNPFQPLPDAGTLLLVGTVLFGLSALVRKAI